MDNQIYYTVSLVVMAVAAAVVQIMTLIQLAIQRKRLTPQKFFLKPKEGEVGGL